MIESQVWMSGRLAIRCSRTSKRYTALESIAGSVRHSSTVSLKSSLPCTDTSWSASSFVEVAYYLFERIGDALILDPMSRAFTSFPHGSNRCPEDEVRIHVCVV
jgi:hypothetical protein